MRTSILPQYDGTGAGYSWIQRCIGAIREGLTIEAASSVLGRIYYYVYLSGHLAIYDTYMAMENFAILTGNCNRSSTIRPVHRLFTFRQFLPRRTG